MSAGRLFGAARREAGQLRDVFRPRLWFFHRLARLLPDHAAPSLRARLYRLAGCDIAPGVALLGRIELIGSGDFAGRLHLETGVCIAADVRFVLDEEISIAENASIGAGTTLTTATHTIGFGSRRMNPVVTPRPIQIGRGAWVAGYSLVLPGVTIGPGAVVSAGAVVAGDIPENVVAAGNPAIVHNKLPFGSR